MKVVVSRFVKLPVFSCCQVREILSSLYYVSAVGLTLITLERNVNLKRSRNKLQIHSEFLDTFQLCYVSIILLIKCSLCFKSHDLHYSGLKLDYFYAKENLIKGYH